MYLLHSLFFYVDIPVPFLLWIVNITNILYYIIFIVEVGKVVFDIQYTC